MGVNEHPVPARPLRLAIPAYGHPALTDVWKRLPLLPPGTTAVLDPANGPGSEPEEIYVHAVERTRAAGVRVHGYVDTLYGMRDRAVVEAEAARFVEWYGVDGVFLDRTAPSGPGFAEAAAVVADLRALRLEVSMNPGVPDVDPAYAGLDALVCSFEGTLAAYRQTTVPEWARDVPGRFWHLVYGTPDEAAMTEAIGRAAATGASAVYVTDRSLPNPWDGLPPYLDAEVAAVAGGPAAVSAIE